MNSFLYPSIAALFYRYFNFINMKCIIQTPCLEFNKKLTISHPAQSIVNFAAKCPWVGYCLPGAAWADCWAPHWAGDPADCPAARRASCSPRNSSRPGPRDTPAQWTGAGRRGWGWWSCGQSVCCGSQELFQDPDPELFVPDQDPAKMNGKIN